jgi:hypothetical protein
MGVPHVSGRTWWVGVACLAFLILLPGRAFAASKVWDGGCGGETAWSCAANWSEDSVPAPGDTVTFNSTSSNDSSVDAGFAGAIATVKVNPGYTGTISLARSLTVSAALIEKAGTFTAGAQALTLKALTLSAGSFTASSGTTAIKGALKISGAPTFDANGGTVDFTGGSGKLSCDNVAFNQATITNTAGTKTVGSDCDLPLGADPTVGSGGSVALNGTLTGTGTVTASRTFSLNASGSLSGFSGLNAYVLKVKGAYDFGSYAPFNVASNFTLTSAGDLTAPAGTATFGKNLTVNSGSAFDANGGTVVFDNSTSVKLACGGKTFNLVSFEFAAGKKTINADCTLPLGEDPSLGGGGTTLRGTLAGSGELSQTGTFTIESGSPGLDSFSDVTDTGSFLVSPGAVLTAPTGALSVNGNLTIASGATFAANGGTVKLEEPPAKATKTITCNGAAFNLVTIANQGKMVVSDGCTLPLGAEPEAGAGGQIVLNGALTGSGALAVKSVLLTLGETGSLTGFTGLETLETGNLKIDGAYDFDEYASFEVGGDFTLSEGAELIAPSGTASFAGDFDDEGEFNANGGTVVLVGSGQEISGSTSFEGLTKVVASADTLTFEAGATQTVEGDLTLEGAEAGKLLKLASSASPTRWLIEVGGSAEVEFASIKDSENLGTPIEALESVDEGNNVGWEIFL